jgi:general secretion pathway protein D
MRAGNLQDSTTRNSIRLNRFGIVIATAALLCTGSCTSIKNNLKKVDAIDPAMGANRSDYKAMGHSKSDGSTPPEPLQVTIEKAVPPIPPIAEILAAPRPPKIGETQLVSIAVTDDVPLKDVLLELAKLADVDIELDAGITGGVSFIAKDKPFNEVIDRIANLAGLRYTMKEGVLRVERDTPFIKSYAVDFLNLDRDSESTVSLSTNVLSSGSGGSSGGGGGVSTGSVSSVKSKTTGDFWKSLESGLTQIVAFAPAKHVSASTLQADANLLTAATGSPPAAPADAAATNASAAAAAAAPAAASGGAAGSSKDYTINRQAGILTLNGTSKQHELVQTLLDKLKANSSAQVLIEAKIIEVDLTQEYRTGINWSAVGENIGGGVSFNALGNVLTSGTDVASISVAKGDLSALISAVEKFGTTRTLSSPRLQ